MSVTTSTGVQNNRDALDRIGEVEHIIEKGAHLLHELVDRVAHPTEADRLLLHQLVAEITGGISRNQARDAITDPAGYTEARDNGAYDVPEPVTPADPQAVRIAELEAEIARMQAAPPAPVRQDPPAAPEVDAASAARIAELEAQVAAMSAAPATADSGHTASDVTPGAQPTGDVVNDQAPATGAGDGSPS